MAEPAQQNNIFAAIDIGSNSIRLKIAEVDQSDGLLRLVTSLRKVTRLGQGVFQKKNKITGKSMKETLAVLQEMSEMCAASRTSGKRAVATSAVRDAKNAGEFVHEAEAILGMPVEVISGPKEADLVHLGVHTRWPLLREKKSLIVDLGGGSAQFIYGHSGGIIDRVSRPLGALRLTERFLKHDPQKA